MQKEQTAKPIIAGVLLLVSAGFKLLGFLALFAAAFFMAVPASYPRAGFLIFLVLLFPLVAIIALCIIGGVYSLQRKRWNLTLAGAIVAILPFSILGIVATVLVAVSRNEFEET